MLADSASPEASWIDGLSEAVYHGDAALSSSGARVLARDGAAAFRWLVENPQGPKKEFDHGHAAHCLVLGAGPEIVVVEADNWRTKKAREQADAAHAAGKVPLLRKDYDVVCAMAAAITAHPLAAPLLGNPSGVSERSLFWTDPVFGVRCRARLDRWTALVSGRWTVVDFKTTTSVKEHKLIRSFYEYGYWQQQDWYQNGIMACGLAEDPGFLFVAQEKTPPYRIQVIDGDHETATWGARRNRKALQMFRDCTESGMWPAEEVSYQILTLPLPRYADTEQEPW